jgi:hypothetical protein
MTFLDYIERVFKFLFKSFNWVIGLIVGAVFGALLSILVIMMVSNGFAFSGGWYWRLLPGIILGALVGIKFWPLMLGFFFGGDGDIDIESDLDLNDSDLTEPERRNPND